MLQFQCSRRRLACPLRLAAQRDQVGLLRRPLSLEELDLIRQQLEGMDDVTAIDPEVRAIVEPN
jgi:hypothetical protein